MMQQQKEDRMNRFKLSLFSIALIMAVSAFFVFLSCDDAGEALTGTLYVGGYSTDKVYVVDIAQLRVVQSIDLPGGSEPDWLTLSPDGKSLYLSAYNQAQIHIIDTDSNSYKTAVDVCPAPMGIDFTPDGSIALVRHGSNSDDIALIDTQTLSYDSNNDTIRDVYGSGGIAVHPALNKFYVTGTDEFSTTNQVHVSDIVGNATPASYSISHTNFLRDVEISADGGSLFVSASGEIDVIHFLDVNAANGSIQSHITKEMEHERSDNDYQGKIRVTPNNTRLYIGAYSSCVLDYIELSNIVTSNYIDLIDYAQIGNGPRDVVFSSGSSFGFVLIDGPDDLVVVIRTSDDSVIDTILLPNCDPRSLVYKQ
jgi:DNA-binding beta-propeller fold protein YncE